MITKLTIAKRIWILILFGVMMLAVSGVITIVNVSRLDAGLKEAVDVELPSTHNVTLADMVHDGIRSVVYQAFFAADEGDTAGLNGALADQKDMSTKFFAYLDALKGLALPSDVLKKVDEVYPKTKVYAESSAKIVSLLANGKKAEARRFLPTFNAAFKDLETSLAALDDFIESNADKNLGRDKQMGEQANRLAVIVVVGGVLLAFLGSGVLIRKINLDLNSLVNKLTAEVQLLDSTAESVARASHQLSEASTEQAAAISETAASMEEMTSMLGQTSHNAAQSLQMSSQGKNDAAEGRSVVRKLGDAMNELQESNQKLENLVAIISQIENKTKVINDIVFETRLLSFNASIEAARAGNHGKGFAVVAEEVGKLASLSGRAAEEIQKLLEDSSNEVRSVVKETRDRLQAGLSISQECGVAFERMGHSMDSIAESVGNISSASREQETGIRQTTQAMSEMDKVTQINSKSSDELASSAGELSSASQHIAVTVDDLRKLVGGGAGAGSKLLASPRGGRRITKAATKSEPAPINSEGNGVVVTLRPKKKPAPEVATSSEPQGLKEVAVDRNDPRWG